VYNHANPGGPDVPSHLRNLDCWSFARLLHDRCFLSLVFRRYICLKFAYDQYVDESVRVDHVQAMCNMLRMCLVLRRKMRQAGQSKAVYMVTRTDCDTWHMLGRATKILQEENFKVRFRESTKLAQDKRAPQADGILKSHEKNEAKAKAAARRQAQKDEEAKGKEGSVKAA